MNFLNDQVRAILWAQFKGIYNKFSGGGSSAGRAIYWVSSLVWYGGVCFLKAGLSATGASSAWWPQWIGKVSAPAPCTGNAKPYAPKRSA